MKSTESSAQSNPIQPFDTSSGVGAGTVQPVISGKTQTSKVIPVVLPAAGNLYGSIQPSEIQVTFAGNQFYVQAASAPISIAGTRGGSTSAENVFGVGQGQKISTGFDILKIANYNAFPVTALVWIGFDDFINDQLILVSTQYTQVAKPTQTDTTATVINIPDISGQSFMDINGKKWGAIQRVAILVFNTSTATTILLQKAGATTATGPAVGVIQPGQPIRFDFSGNYCINIGGAAIPAIVSEIYQAFPI